MLIIQAIEFLGFSNSSVHFHVLLTYLVRRWQEKKVYCKWERVAMKAKRIRWNKRVSEIRVNLRYYYCQFKIILNTPSLVSFSSVKFHEYYEYIFMKQKLYNIKFFSKLYLNAKRRILNIHKITLIDWFQSDC